MVNSPNTLLSLVRYAVAESLADSEEEDANPLLPLFLAKLPVILMMMILMMMTMIMIMMKVIPFHNNTRVISTALDCIGGFSDWLAVMIMIY